LSADAYRSTRDDRRREHLQRCSEWKLYSMCCSSRRLVITMSSANDRKKKSYVGHTAIQHPHRMAMAGKLLSSDNGSRHQSNYFVHAHDFEIRNAFIAEGAVPGMRGWFHSLHIRCNVSAKFSMSIGEANHALYTERFFVKAVSLNEVFDRLHGN
jgi:hypothetical protein